MTFYELMDITQSIGGRLDAQWGFFITIHMALLGAVFFIERPVPVFGKLAAMLVYALFAASNYRALRLQHGLLERTYDDIVKLSDATCCQNSELMTFYVSEVANNFGTRMMVVASLLHLSAFVVFALSVFAIRSRIKSTSASD